MTVIEINNVNMLFNLSDEKVDNLKELLIRKLKGKLNYKKFTALSNISLKIDKGEKIGIIGLNGSGKSTLLKIIAGVMKPTSGTVKVIGSVSPLIELGAGFDLDLSAKENIFLNGAILGYSDTFINEHYSKILDFSELTSFENVAIKNFSSGMIARLGFSIATCTIPDILIVDEILAVGDFEFQKKCKDKMSEMTKNGVTIIFVSHDPAQVCEICEKVIWLEKGKIIEVGKSKDIVSKYMNLDMSMEV